MLRGEGERLWPCWTPAEYDAARAVAERELGVPKRGPRGSLQNRFRRGMGTLIAARTRRILWLRRALGSDYGKE